MSLGENLSRKGLLHPWKCHLLECSLQSSSQFLLRLGDRYNHYLCPLLDSTVSRHLELQFLMGVVTSLTLSHRLLYLFSKQCDTKRISGRTKCIPQNMISQVAVIRWCMYWPPSLSTKKPDVSCLWSSLLTSVFKCCLLSLSSESHHLPEHVLSAHYQTCMAWSCSYRQRVSETSPLL